MPHEETVTDVVRTAVVGAGYFGRFHALKHAANPDIELVAVVDVDAARAEAIASECGCIVLPDLDSLVGKVDAVSVAVPTTEHYAVASALLEKGLHVLVEKPITSDSNDAARLVEAARARDLVLAVGHVERFSPAYAQLRDIITEPRYIESHRISQWKPRANDVDVILDLMIHDIDIILGLVNAPVLDVNAVGAGVVSPTEDIANARISFVNGCVATVTASRISHKTQRTMRIFQPDSYVVCDFAENRIVQFRKTGESLQDGVPVIDIATTDVTPYDALEHEIAEFIKCVAKKDGTIVDGSDGLTALEITDRVRESLRAHRALCADYQDQTKATGTGVR